MRVLVTGSAGYVGSMLVPTLIRSHHHVVGYDLVEHTDYNSPHFTSYKADIRDLQKLQMAMHGCDAVIHLACISNDPSADLDPELTKSINLDSFRPMLRIAKAAGVKRFILASSSSVYGVKSEPDVTEDLELNPLTDYSKYKALCEQILFQEREPGFETVVIRPATVCGYAPALRLDLCVHLLTTAAIRDGVIKVFGGNQNRPNIHIHDICDAYLILLEARSEQVDGEVFNCGARNLTILQTAELVKARIGDAKIDIVPVFDERSYSISSKKFETRFNWVPFFKIEDAIDELVMSFNRGRIGDPESPQYHRIKSLKLMGLAA